MKRMLLLSNSRMPGRGYLEHALEAIAATLGGARRLVLIPYASVTTDWDSVAKAVRMALQPVLREGATVSSIHHAKRPVEALREAEAVLVNGGNTFHLLHHLRRKALIVPLRMAILAGLPYVGWSAGANICAPSIRTTNDMPIIDPGGFDALGVIDFQINPHYTNAVPEGWMGETRDQRLGEFLHLHPGIPVIGLPEGDWLEVLGDSLTVRGSFPARWFRAGAPTKLLEPGSPVPAAG
ncbi:MAG: dipeptidase PepE [Casimicrobiaceae bacterium]|nr:dipeptidase PepE [Casimicrobiaceae bacterium]